MGDRQAVAAELHIHPQTVRYRMSQLHAAFGRSLDDPATRTRLTLALAWGSATEPNLRAPESDETAPVPHPRRKAI
jgi:DNA-binding PucR family transcriptional regulator